MAASKILEYACVGVWSGILVCGLGAGFKSMTEHETRSVEHVKNMQKLEYMKEKIERDDDYWNDYWDRMFEEVQKEKNANPDIDFQEFENWSNKLPIVQRYKAQKLKNFETETKN